MSAVETVSAIACPSSPQLLPNHVLHLYTHIVPLLGLAFAVPLIPAFLAFTVPPIHLSLVFIADLLSLPSALDIASYVKMLMQPVDWQCADSLELEVGDSAWEE